jgi:hypothetical protein
MTDAELVQYLKGFIEALDGKTPSKKQLEKIVAKIKTETTEYRYKEIPVPTPIPYPYQPYPYWHYGTTCAVTYDGCVTDHAAVEYSEIDGVEYVNGIERKYCFS